MIIMIDVKIEKKIVMLEKYLGFELRREIITFGSNEPHNESFSYGLALKFYNENKALMKAIMMATEIVKDLDGNDDEHLFRGLMFCLLGDMYYLYGDFNRSLGCFIQSLKLSKNDYTTWVGFMFAIRATDNIELFEKMIFNLGRIYDAWNDGELKSLERNDIEDFLEGI